MNEVPVYVNSFSYAREHGEIQEFRESYHADIECGKAIDDSITDHFDGMHLHDGVLDSVTEEFSRERIAKVLAETVIYAWSDGRFSESNRKWAKKIRPDQPTDAYEDYLVILQSHPAVLNGFINDFRKEEEHGS